MSPVTHFLIGWVVANSQPCTHRERAIIALAGVIPDLDGLGIVIDFLKQDQELTLWSKYHHLLGHNFSFGLAVTVLGFGLAQQQWKAAALTLLSFHSHLLGDLVGSRGPDGYQWPIYYLFPVSLRAQLSWEHQWALNAWPNFVITGLVLVLTFYLAWRRGYSPLEMISAKADERLVETLRQRF